MTLQEDACQVKGCERKRHSRGWCPAHYNQWHATGKTPSVPFTVAGRFSRYFHQGSESECWEWQSTRNRNGYGKFWLNGRTDLAHRVSYRLFHGSIPDGMSIRHTCDNPPCVNPSHLLTGTIKDNARDALDRNRYKRGSDNGSAKLTPEQVTEIRRGWKDGLQQVDMARHYAVSKSTIQWILNGRTWSGIGELP